MAEKREPYVSKYANVKRKYSPDAEQEGGGKEAAKPKKKGKKVSDMLKSKQDKDCSCK